MTKKVYMIRSEISRLVYIGSTSLNLSKRLSLHKSRYQRREAGQPVPDCAVSRIFKVDPNPSIMLLSEYNDDSELLRYHEQNFIDEYSQCPYYKVVNIRRAWTPK